MSHQVIEKYRYVNGQLFKFSSIAGAYVHVYRSMRNETKEQAIASYEAECDAKE